MHLEQKKLTKVKRGHSPNWVNSEKAKCTIAENPDYWRERDKKTKATNLKRHGDPKYVNVERIAAVMQEKYGVKCYTQTKEYRMKVISTSRRKYGCDSPN